MAKALIYKELRENLLIALGALVASLADKSFKLESVPPIWSDRFGSGVGLRAVGAFAGGVVAMFGARLAVDEGRVEQHVADWVRTLEALRDDRLDLQNAKDFGKLNDCLDSVIGEDS